MSKAFSQKQFHLLCYLLLDRAFPDHAGRFPHLVSTGTKLREYTWYAYSPKVVNKCNTDNKYSRFLSSKCPGIYTTRPDSTSRWQHSGICMAGRISHVDTQHYHAPELVKSYALSPALVQFLPRSEVLVGTITTSRPIPLQNDTSSRVMVHYQQGTKQAFSLLLDIRNS